jgi:hypothetical protein
MLQDTSVSGVRFSLRRWPILTSSDPGTVLVVSTFSRACNRPAACASSSEVIKSASVP